VKFVVQENKRPIKVNVKMEMRATGDMDAGIGARRMVIIIQNISVNFSFKNIFGRGESAELTYVKGIRESGGYNFGFSGFHHS
jgi:hypothetical protein